MEKLLLSLQALFSIVSSCPSMGDCEACVKENFEIFLIGKLPSEIAESSGIAIYQDMLFTHSDSGNDPILYSVTSPFLGDVQLHGKIDFTGEHINKDWEDLALDDKKYIYIGDFGNNFSRRHDLGIIKYDPIANSTDKINFKYSDQKAFPPKGRKNLNYDSEAFFWARDSLYIFTKNKGKKVTNLYAISDQPGSYNANRIASLPLKSPITSADISPSGQLMVLLSYGKIFLYSVAWPIGAAPVFTPYTCISFRGSGQVEAITFIDNQNWLITNENGDVYWMRANTFLLPELENEIRDVDLTPVRFDDTGRPFRILEPPLIEDRWWWR